MLLNNVNCYSSNTENPYAADVSRRVITKAGSHMQYGGENNK